MKNGRRVKNTKRNSSNRSKSKVLDISIIILIIALIVVIGVGTIRDKKTLARNMETYSGDSTSSSESSLSKWLEETYKSKANITNLSQDKATVKVGLEELEKNKDTFDLAYIIFGENDQKALKPNEFKEDYEKIIEILKERNKNISIVPIIENSLRKKNEYTTIIEGISKANDLKVLDMATVFTKDPAPYAKLTTKGGIYPNNVGYSLYFSNVKSLIEANIAALN
ncbi:MAG: SGNH/GDSL hydrolase family protein [Clostridium perfringens]|nr:SGNH/GDSL hydrolase family protein [Clostridium perfringens]